MFRLKMNGTAKTSRFLASLCFLFGGCSTRPTSAAEAAITYLNRKYDGEYVVDGLERKRGTGFSTREYYGTVWKAGEPENRFSIKVSADFRKVEDSSYALSWRPLLQEKADQLVCDIFQTGEAWVMLECLDYRPHHEQIYSVNELSEVLQTCSARGNVVLMVPEEMISIELLDQWVQFSDQIGEIIPGFLNVYTSNDRGLDMPLEKILKEKPVLSIRLGSSETTIRWFLEESSRTAL